MKKKLLTILMIALLAAFSYTDVYAEDAITKQKTLDETAVVAPRIVYYGSEIVSNDFYCLRNSDSTVCLGSGNLSSTLEDAISNPLVIESGGQSVLLSLLHHSDPSKDEEIILYPGDVGSICFNKQYLYVIVSGKPTETDNTSTKKESDTSTKKKKSKPKLLQEYEQPRRDEAKGSFIVSAKGYGVLISGNAYTADHQLKHPISIDSSGYPITVTYSYPLGATYTKTFNSACSGLFHEIYLVIK